jgi:hypothetical protein
MSNALDPRLMSAAERLDEIAEILAAGLMRLRARKWRELFETEPPAYNRRFLESRLAYRIQELAYGGLKPETIERLEALGEQLDGGNPIVRRTRTDMKPIAGTRLIREWQGVEHCVTVLDDGYEYQGRPYKSLSAIARAITGTRWNGWYSSASRTSGRAHEEAVVRKLRCAVYTRKSTEEGLDMEFNSLDAQREACEAYIASQKPEGWVLVPDHYDDGGFSGGTLERPALKRLLADIEAGRVDVVVVYKIDRLSRSLMDFAKLVEVFDRRRHLRERHPVVQHDHVDGPADAQHPALLRPVRARGHRRAHPGQDRGLASQGHVDGRLSCRSATR